MRKCNMDMKFIRKLPTPQELKEEFPISAEITAAKEKRDEEIRRIFTGESDKFLLIIGPCSADNEDAEEARSATAMSPRAMRSRASRKRRRSCADHLASLSSSRAPLARSREARVDRTGNP